MMDRLDGGVPGDTDALTPIGGAPTTPTITGGDPAGMEMSDQDIAAKLKPEGMLHQKLLGRLRSRIDLSRKHMEQRYDSWDEVDETMRMRIDLSRNAKKADGTTDTTKKEMPFQRGAVIPASYAIHEVRKTQLYSLFAHRDPFTQLEGRGPEDVRAAQLLEAVMSYDQQQTKVRQVIWSLIQDADKYGVGIIYDCWEDTPGWKTGPAPITKIPAQFQGIAAKVFPKLAQPTKTFGIVKEFNSWRNVDPFNFWPDPRAPIAAPDEWEYGGHRTFKGMTYVRGRSMQYGGPYFNLDYASKYANEGTKRENYSRSRYALDTFSLGNTTDEKDRGFFALDHLQVRLIPSEWDLGPGLEPENWWFTLLDEALIIRAHKSAYDHGQFTYAVGEVNHDPHSMFNHGTMENLGGLQRIINWLTNSHIENVRKAMNIQAVFDPTMIEEEDLENPGPMWHVRLTQAGIAAVQSGRRVDEFFSQIKFDDVTAGNLNTVKFLFDMLQQMGASNDPAQGQALESKRTLGEIQSIMSSSSARNSVTAQLLDSMVFEPLAERAIANRQQFTTVDQYFRIAGDLAKEAGAQQLLVKAPDLAGSFDYVPHSGVAPQDPARQAETWLNAITAASKIPQLMQPGADGKVLDLREPFNEFLRTSGIKNVDTFYQILPQMYPMGVPGAAPPGVPGQTPQVVPNAQFAQQAQAGNFVTPEQAA